MSALGKSAATVAKVCIRSRRPSKAGKPQERELVILGNGPSLKQTIGEQGGFLTARDLLAVNFAANTPEFFALKPKHYVLADPHFFRGAQTDSNVARLWENLHRAADGMTLHVPCRERHNPLLKGLNVRFFNLTPGEGFRWLRHALYDAGLAMPRPRNVLIASIMVAVRLGYGKIYLAGADHSWSKTLDVDEQNRVVSVQPHFYSDGKEEHARVAAEYAGYRLHDILRSLCVAFESYHLIAPWARKRGVEILNITPGSMIDAFPRFTPESGESAAAEKQS